MAPPLGIDIHSHFYPEGYLRLIDQEGAASGARIDRSRGDGPAIILPGATTPPLSAAYWDLDLRIKTMNRTGIAVQALSLTSPMVYFASAEPGAPARSGLQ